MSGKPVYRHVDFRISEELWGWIHADADEFDVSITFFLESMLRAAFKKIGSGEALRLGSETVPARGYRSMRTPLPWVVTKTVTWNNREVPAEFHCGKYRLTHIGRRGRGRSTPDDRREPHGRDDQSIPGWYLLGPNVVGSPFVWLGTAMMEAKREAISWVR
jgi:hypothetical protein